MKNCINVVECAIEKDDKYLVIRRPNNAHVGGFLSFPGGKVEIEGGHKQL